MDKTKNETQTADSKQEFYEELLQLADHYASVADHPQAQHYYGQAASLDPDDARPYVGLGLVAVDRQLFDEAEIAFRVACRLDPDCSRGYAGLALIAQNNDNHEEAFDHYLKSLELDTDNLSALLGLFQASCQMGSFAKVIHYLEVYLTMHPEDDSVKFSLAALHVKEGAFEQAEKILEAILISDHQNTDAQNLLEEVQRSIPQTAGFGV